MRTLYSLSALLIALLIAGVPHVVVATDGKPAEDLVVKIDDLNSRGAVIGLLAVPLGKVVTIEAEIVDGTKLRAKALDGVALLQVTAVNGQKLTEFRVIRFNWFATADAKKLKGQVKLVGYETGCFAGVPGEAFLHIEPVATEGFHFESSFVVLKAL
jgi:hypothetical protein